MLNRKSVWGLADQALSSATNVALTIVVAREVGTADLGAFGVAYAAYLILVGLSRAVSSEPLLVRHAQGGARESTGIALACGVVTGALLYGAAVVLGGRAEPALASLALFLPGLLLKDAWRYVFIAGGRPARAILNDGVWAAGQVVGVGWVAVTHPTVGWFVFAWGASATVAAAFGVVQSRERPAPLRSLRWIAAHRDLLPGYVVDFGARMGGRQLSFLTVSALGGLAAMGAIRAAEVLFGVMNVVLQGAPLVFIPQAVAAARRSPAALRREVTRLSAGMTALALGYGALVLLVPDHVGRSLVGASWTEAQPVLIAECALFAGIAAMSGPTVGLRALGDARRGATVRLLVVPMSLGFGATGAVLAGAPGAVSGLALANGIGLALWFRQFRRALAGVRPAPEAATSPAASQPA